MVKSSLIDQLFLITWSYSTNSAQPLIWIQKPQFALLLNVTELHKLSQLDLELQLQHFQRKEEKREPLLLATALLFHFSPTSWTFE